MKLHEFTETDGANGLVWTARLDNNQMEYAVRMHAIHKGGTLSNKDGKLSVNGADEVVFLVTADTDYLINYAPNYTDPKAYVGVNPQETTAAWMKDAETMGYEALYDAHYKDYASLFNRVSLSLNPMAGPWLATHVWDYYDYTRDKQFLKETGYELIKTSAQFAVDYLWKKPDGTYTAAPSTSPEHGPIDQGATFVHAVIREILLNAIDASKALGVDKKERKQWEEVLAKLAPYQVGRYGQLMEWSKDIDDPKDQHRHVNHLFGLHPGHTLSPITTPELAEASKIVLEHRGDGATGWSMGWKLNQWARLHDGNFGGTAGVTEMLIQSHMGFIHLLPALPDAWKDGEVKGLCAKGNFEVGFNWKNGELNEVCILSKSGGTCEVRYKDAVLKLKTAKGKSYTVSYQNGKLMM